eukprot:3646837-Pyramimonas_sp.AAC.2
MAASAPLAMQNCSDCARSGSATMIITGWRTNGTRWRMMRRAETALPHTTRAVTTGADNLFTNLVVVLAHARADELVHGVEVHDVLQSQLQEQLVQMHLHDMALQHEGHVQLPDVVHRRHALDQLDRFRFPRVLGGEGRQRLGVGEGRQRGLEAVGRQIYSAWHVLTLERREDPRVQPDAQYLDAVDALPDSLHAVLPQPRHLHQRQVQLGRGVLPRGELAHHLPPVGALRDARRLVEQVPEVLRARGAGARPRPRARPHAQAHGHAQAAEDVVPVVLHRARMRVAQEPLGPPAEPSRERTKASQPRIYVRRATTQRPIVTPRDTHSTPSDGRK